MNGNFLFHIGVPGMRWGIRRGGRSNSKSSSNSSSEKLKISKDYAVVSRIKKKKLAEMSNDDLKAIANRAQLEKQYKDLNPEKTAAGKKAVAETMALFGKTALSTIATQVGTKVGTEGAQFLIKNLFPK